MLRDMAMYWKDWFLSPVLVSQELVEDEDRNSLATAGFLLGLLFMILFQILNVVFLGVPLGFDQVVTSFVYVAILFVLDLIFLEIVSALTDANVSLGDNIVIAGIVATTSVFALFIAPIILFVPSVNDMLALPLMMGLHGVYLLASMKGVSDKSWLSIIGASLLAFVLIFIAFGLGTQVHILLFNAQ